MKKIEFKPIPFAPEYLISNTGIVLSKKGKPMKLAKHSRTGHLCIALHANRKRLSKGVHRIVLTTFGPTQPTPKHECRHLDGNPKNNHISNLAWGTSKENKADAKKHGTTARGERNGKSLLNEEKVIKMRKIYSTTQISWEALGRKFKVGRTAARGAVYGRTWRHVKYLLNYFENSKWNSPPKTVPEDGK